MDKNNNYASLKKLCLNIGIDLFGVADVTEVKKDFLLSGCILEMVDRAVCLGVRLSRGVLEEIENAPTRLYFHHYKTTNAFLDQSAFKLSGYIQEKGHLAIPIAASQIVDWQNQRAHLSHKHVGYLAGLGWIGRNNLLVNDKLGSQFRLVTILTNMPLKADKPVKKGCEECLACVRICPAAAIHMQAQEFEHLKCFEQLKEFQKQRLVDQYICGVCLKACKGN